MPWDSWTAEDRRAALLGAVLLVLGVGFHAATSQFLTAENLYNLLQQTAVTGIVAAALSLLIIARQIDLSVGSLLGVVGVLMAWLMYEHGWSWPLAVGAALAVSLAVSLVQGGLTAWLGVPSFVVTLGGLVSLRGAAFLVADGKTQPVTDESFLALGGGLDGSLGVMGSWLLALLLLALLPWWREPRRAAIYALVLLGVTALCASYRVMPERPGQGLPYPLLIWAAAVALLQLLATRTRLGRHTYALGSNPEAVRLAGVPVPWVLVRLYLLLGAAVALAALVAVARLNAGTNSLGTGLELQAIAAAVIGGVALAGGAGSPLGTVLGALLMQVLDNGLLLLDVPIGWRMVLIGQVLIVAVVLDRRSAR